MKEILPSSIDITKLSQGSLHSLIESFEEMIDPNETEALMIGSVNVNDLVNMLKSQYEKNKIDKALNNGTQELTIKSKNKL